MQTNSQNVLLYKKGVKDVTEYSSMTDKIGKKKVRKPHVLDANFKPVYELAKIDYNKGMMKYDKLKNILRQYNEYPEKYRILIWRFMLSLPLNKSSFESYLKKGIHPNFTNLDERFPVKSAHNFNKLVRILSALAYWCPVFAEIDYLPQIVYPFVKIIKNDDLILFEVVMSFFMQHC